MIETLIKNLKTELESALSLALKDILVACKDEQLYAIGLFTNDSIHAVSIIANTEQKLSATVKDYNDTVDKEYDITSTLNGMRWSYGDWGYQTIGNEYFSKANDALYEIEKKLDSLDDDAIDNYYSQLWSLVINAFNTLNNSQELNCINREDVTLILCGDLPDDLISNSVKTLNPAVVSEKYASWEPED